MKMYLKKYFVANIVTINCVDLFFLLLSNDILPIDLCVASLKLLSGIINAI